MKRFYTFEPKNFRILAKMKSFIAVALLFVMALGTVNAERIVLTFGSGGMITTTSGTINSYLSFSSAKNSSSTNAVGSYNDLRLYYAGNGNGGSITFKLANDAVINSVVLYAAPSRTPNLSYTIGAGTPTAVSLSGTVYTISGIAVTDSLTIQNVNTSNTQLRCDSMVITYKAPCTTPVELSYPATTCAGVPVNFFGTNVTDPAGVYTHTINGATIYDCDTVYTLDLTVIEPVTYEFNHLLPEGTTWNFNGTDITAAGDYSYNGHLTAANGCDSNVTVHVTIGVGMNINDETQVACDSYTFHKFNGDNIICTETNIYYDTLPGAAIAGLDSIHILRLTVNPSYNQEIYVTKCQSELPFTFGAITFGPNSPVRVYPNPYVQTFQTVNGCDSTVTMHLTISESFTATDELTICENALPYTWNGVVFTEAGTQTTTLTASNGCDSTVTMTLSVNMNTAETINVEVIENDLPYVLNGDTFLLTNTYTQTIQNANGCDSVITLNLTVYNNVATTVDSTICASALPFTWNEVAFTEAGTQSATLVGNHGVDSVVTMNLAVNPVYAVVDSTLIMDISLPYTWNGVTFTEAGTQSATLTTVDGCDSVVTMILTVLPTYQITTVCEHGRVTPASLRIPTIPINFSFYPDECYELGEVILNGDTVTDQVAVMGLTEDFDVITDSNSLVRIDTVLNGWTGSNLYSANKKVRLGKSSGKGIMTLPGVIMAPGEYTISFDAQAWNGGDEQTSFLLIVDNDTTLVEGLSKTAMNHYSYNYISDGRTPVVVTFEGRINSKNRFFIDNIAMLGDNTAPRLHIPSITEDITLVAEFNQIQYEVTTVVVGNGTIDPITTIGCGDTLTINMNANEGWHIDNYTVNGVTTTMGNNTDVAAQATIVGDSAASVEVVFAINTYNVATSVVTGQGTFTPETQVVNHGDNAVVTVVADSVNGYHIVDIDGNVYGNNTDVNVSYTLANVVSDTTISANFALNEYPITVINLNPDHGTVVPATQDWTWGESADFVITPEAVCYYISEITVDGTALVAGTDYTVDGYTYTFNNVDAEHTLQVNFSQVEFNMTATVYPNSTATVTTGTVHCDESFTFHIEAGVGQHLSDIFVDGMYDTTFNNQEDVYDVTIDSIRENHSVYVMTAIDHYEISVSSIGEGSTDQDGVLHDIAYNTPITFNFTPATCQELVSFTIDGVEHISDVVDNAYTWYAASNAQIVATFDTIVYTMTETHTGNGTVNTGNVNCGEDFVYTFEAEQGWHIAQYTLNGTTTSNTEVEPNDWTSAFDTAHAVTANTEISVVFERNTYTVSVCDPGNGNTLTTDLSTVYYDSTAVITVNAGTGYHITSINGLPTAGANTDVTATYNVLNIQRDTTICATFDLNNYTITASVTDDVNGAITPAGETAVQYGDTLAIEIRPTNDCHYISTIVIDGNGTTYYNDSVPYTYYFNNITDNHTIVANFETYRYEVATSVNDVNFGTVTPTDTLDCGETFNYTVTPEVGYHIVSVLEDGVAQTITDSLTFSSSFTDIHANHTVEVNFGINHYDIVVTTGANGSITPGDTVLEHGQSVTYTITPDDCYYISEVLVDGVALRGITTTGMDYTFEAITGAHTLEANFEIYQYQMQETHTGNGTVTTATVNCGDIYTYNITAAQGWHIANYSIGGATYYNTLPEPNDYNTEVFTINGARQDTTLNVTFEIDTYTVSACTAVGGTLTVNNPVEVDSNSNTSVTVVADAANGYHIVRITDNRGGEINLGGNTNVMYIYPVNNVDQDIEVCAEFALNTFEIHAEAGANGTIIPEGDTTITYGDTITYTIEPNHTCYYISGINVDGTNVWTGYTDSISATTYTFVASDFAAAAVNHSITTEYTIFKYNMASTSTNLSYPVVGGTVTSNPSVDCATDYDYVITSATGYHIDHVVLDGVTTNYTGQQANDVITVSDIHEHHQLDAYFAINHYDIVASCTENGTITPVGTTDVEHFSSLTYNIDVPEACYHIDAVLVDGVPVADIAPNTTDLAHYTYTFSNIDGPHTIHAIITIDRYAMAETHVGNGTITTDTVECGDAYQYTITADYGWHINNHTLGGTTYTLNHNNDVVAYRNVTVATQDTVLDVVFSRNLYTVTVTSTGNGVTTPGTSTYEFEDDATFTMTPNTGYNVLDVLVDGVSVGAVTSYTFNDIEADHTLDVVYTADIYVVNASAEDHGTITVAGDNQVAYGESVNFTIVADPCYNISAVLVDGVADADFVAGQSVATYTLDNVDANHTVVAQFAINTYNVTVNTIGNGTATPATGTYNCGDDVTFTFTPDAGNSVASVVVNGTNVGAVTTYTINNIGADYTIDVTFTANVYTLNAVAYNNGTITPAGETVVAEGDNFIYTLAPAACQTVSDILVDGVSYLDSANFDGTTLTLNDIQSDMLIQAYFQVMTYNVEATQAAGGVITETGVFDCGTDVVYTITPDACYSITDVLVDGASVGAVDTYTFAAIDADHTITATFAIDTYTVTATAGQGGTITDTETFDCGETPTYTITPDAGYYIENVDVDGVSMGAIDTYTFGALNADHTIDATFAIYTYTVTANANAGVEIAPAAGETVVEYGDNLTYNFTVDACYDIVDVTVDGESVGAVTTYTLSDIQANHVVNVTAAVKTYTITATVAGEGTITPAGETTVACDGSQFYAITPAVGYVIDDVTVDGASVGAVTSYNFENVTADHTIAVVFTAIADSTYTITATATGNGTITPAGATTVNYGASQTYTMVADQYYTIGDVLVDGESVGAVPTYTFANVTANHTIEVIFTEGECEVPTYAWTDPITNTTATLNWTDMDATSYTVRYKLASDTAYTVVANITDNFYDLTGLEENTEYVWNVKSVCVANVAESNWTAQQSFRTEGADQDTTGIQNLDLAAMNVYSNGNSIYVVNNSNEQINEVQVFDLNGRMVYTGAAQSNPTVINVNAANGIYVVRVVTATMTRNYKVAISQR